ncbi:hypothetical protein ABID29_000383 [Streptococcus rupicaprae]|uniref:Uridine kinase n=1 Tax=Streptococcus rupicaprae TaxID=759619 RepID=A0ABV2FFC4_9STRE
MLLSQDYLRRTVLASKDGPNTPTIPLILAMLEAGKELCEVIILEGILRADWYKPVWHYLQHDFPGQVLAYYYDLTFEETLRRHHSRDLVSAFGADRMKEWFVRRTSSRRYLKKA